MRKLLGMSIEPVANEAQINAKQYQLLESGLANRYPESPANPTFGMVMAVSMVFQRSIPQLHLDMSFENGELSVRFYERDAEVDSK